MLRGIKAKLTDSLAELLEVDENLIRALWLKVEQFMSKADFEIFVETGREKLKVIEGG